MSRLISALLLLAVLSAGCVTVPVTSAPRLDASNAAAAQASYKVMMDRRSPAEQQKLAVAVLMLNMEGVRSASELIGNPELQSPSIARIRDKVAGMTADQIIERANKNPLIRIEVPGK